jgi:flagellar biosynthesis protein FlhG
MEQNMPKIWAVGSGKGVVGKSFFSANLAVGLAGNGKKVVLLDADPMGTNLHTLFNLEYPKHTFFDYLSKKVDDINDILLRTETEDLNLVCGAGDVLDLANPDFPDKQELTDAVSSLGADYLIADLGSGTDPIYLDFLNSADMGFVVINSNQTSVENAYEFLRLALNRKVANLFADDQEIAAHVNGILETQNRINNMDKMLDSLKEISKDAYACVLESLASSRLGVVANMATEVEGERISRTISSIANEFLKVDLQYLGFIEFDANVGDSIKNMLPLTLVSDSTESAPEMGAAEAAGEEKKIKSPVVNIKSGMQSGLNEDVEYEGKTFHVQTEDLGVQKEKVLTLVFQDGRILFSKSTSYGELGDKGNLLSEKINWQHQAILSGIRSGKLKDKLSV